MKIKESGFREYDARWLYPKDIDLEGIEELGKGLGTQVINKKKTSEVNEIYVECYKVVHEMC